MEIHTSAPQNISRVLMGACMVIAGAGHLTFARETFQVQVPDWVPMDKDLVVVLSGYAEILLGLLLLFWAKQRVQMGLFMALFYIMVFPGNISQYVNARDGFGLNSDALRFARLLFQPVPVFWALWSTGAWHWLRKRFQ